MGLGGKVCGVSRTPVVFLSQTALVKSMNSLLVSLEVRYPKAE